MPKNWANNPAKTYKDTANYAGAICKSMRPFNSVFIHCGVLHYQKRKVANKDDLLGGCPLLGRILFLYQQFPNECFWPVI